MIDPSKYTILKSLDSITGISVDGDDIAVTSKAFDPNTGEQLPDITSCFSLSYFEGQISYYQNQISNLTQILDDCALRQSHD